jgi:hypothetical protein
MVMLLLCWKWECGNGVSFRASCSGEKEEGKASELMDGRGNVFNDLRKWDWLGLAMGFNGRVIIQKPAASFGPWDERDIIINPGFPGFQEAVCLHSFRGILCFLRSCLKDSISRQCVRK